VQPDQSPSQVSDIARAQAEHGARGGAQYWRILINCRMKSDPISPKPTAAVNPAHAKDRGASVAGGAYRQKLVTAVCAGISAIGVALACLTFGCSQFGGFDHSVLIDIGWRISQGQHPYVDFPCTVPVWWAYGIGLAFNALGPSWLTVVLLQAAFSAVTCIWMYWLIYGIWQDSLRAAMTSIALQAGINLVTSYWWYNTLTATAACLVHLSLLRLFSTPSSASAMCSCAVSMAMLMGSKPNVALPLIAASPPLLWLATRSTKQAVCLPVVAGLLVTAVLAALEISPMQVILAYCTVAGRALTIETFVSLIRDMDAAQRLMTWILLGVCVAMALATAVLFRAYRAVPGVIGLVTCGAAAIGFLTNGEHKLVDLSIVFCALWSTYAVLRIAPQQPTNTSRLAESALDLAFTGLCCLWISYGFYVSATRERVRAIGPFYDAKLSSNLPGTKFFRSLRCSEEFLNVEAQVARVLNVLEPKNVFFGPRMQWAYAAFDYASPHNEPVWWHSGVSYGRDQETVMLQAWRANEHDVLIFYRQDATYLSEEMLRDVRIDYMQVAGAPTLSVFIARKHADAFRQRLEQ
jgi:hypothetical protein